MPHADHKHIEIRTFGNVIIVHLKDSKIVDAATLQPLRRQLSRLINRKSGQRVFLDLVHVQFLSSAVLNWLILMQSRIKAKGGHFALCRVQPAIEQVFKITRLDQVLPIEPYPDEEDPQDGTGGVPSPVNPNRPANEGSIALEQPPFDSDDA